LKVRQDRQRLAILWRTVMTPTLLALALTVAAPAPKTAPKKDPPSVAGEWALESALLGAVAVEREEGPCVLTISADGKFGIREGEDDVPEVLTYRLAPAKDPAEIDLATTGDPPVTRVRGIYKVDGDTVLLCWTEKGGRPTTFASPAGSKVALYTFRRVKPKE
jgi:uncharacterized protein (TIGR03067 family)